MDCFYCLSIWVACPFAFAIAPRRREVAVWCLALSGAACLLERVLPGTEGVEDVDTADEAERSRLWSGLEPEGSPERRVQARGT
jgi:hypothetical protein